MTETTENTTGTIDGILAAVKAQLGTAYPVLSSYDATEDFNPEGTLAVNITECEDMHHAGCRDFRFGVQVGGLTLADEDRDRSAITAMLNHAMLSLGDLSAVRDAVPGCVGAVMGSAAPVSDGETNAFSIDFDLYVCDAVFC